MRSHHDHDDPDYRLVWIIFASQFPCARIENKGIMSTIEYTNTSVSFAELVTAVKSNDYATAFRLNQVVISGGEDDCVDLSRALRGHPCLKEFSLIDVSCEAEGVDLSQVVSMVLITLPKLEILKAERTTLTAAALTTVGFCSSLKMLILPNNGLTDKDAVTLGDALAASHSLQLLDLRGNKMTDVGCATFANVIGKSMSLCSFLLDENSCSEKGLGQINSAILARSATAA
jgi:hypothetical protein